MPLGVLVVREGMRAPLRSMDYIIAGVATVLLFVYLVYALLKPERF